MRGSFAIKGNRMSLLKAIRGIVYCIPAVGLYMGVSRPEDNKEPRLERPAAGVNVPALGCYGRLELPPLLLLPPPSPPPHPYLLQIIFRILTPLLLNFA